MPYIEIDRNLFGCLVDRWYKLEIEHRGFRAMLDESKRRNPHMKDEMEALLQITTDALRNDWIEFDSELRDAWAIQDDDAFLLVLDRFLSQRETAQ